MLSRLQSAFDPCGVWLAAHARLAWIHSSREAKVCVGLGAAACCRSKKTRDSIARMASSGNPVRSMERVVDGGVCSIFSMITRSPLGATGPASPFSTAKGLLHDRQRPRLGQLADVLGHAH